MEKHQVILDNYLHGYQKFLVFNLLIASFFGSLNYLLNPAKLTDLLYGLILLVFTYILLVAMIGKKGLYFSDNKFYRGIAVADKFLLKERVVIENYSGFTFSKKEITDLPWLFEYSGMAMFSNYHECSVYLTKSSSKKRKILISMADFEMYYEVRGFLRRWTKLKERNDNAQNNNP